MGNHSPESKKVLALTKALREAQEAARIAQNNLEVERQHHANTKIELAEVRAEYASHKPKINGYIDAHNVLDTLPVNTPRRVCNPHSGEFRPATVAERIVRLAAYSAS